MEIETIENHRAELPRELQVKLDVAENQVRVELVTDIVVVVVTDNDGELCGGVRKMEEESER